MGSVLLHTPKSECGSGNSFISTTMNLSVDPNKGEGCGLKCYAFRMGL